MDNVKNSTGLFVLRSSVVSTKFQFFGILKWFSKLNLIKIQIWSQQEFTIRHPLTMIHADTSDLLDNLEEQTIEQITHFRKNRGARESDYSSDSSDSEPHPQQQPAPPKPLRRNPGESGWFAPVRSQMWWFAPVGSQKND